MRKEIMSDIVYNLFHALFQEHKQRTGHNYRDGTNNCSICIHLGNVGKCYLENERERRELRKEEVK